MDRIAATGLDPAGAAADEPLRPAPCDRCRLRAVRGLQLHEHLSDLGLCQRSLVLAERRSRHSRAVASQRALVAVGHIVQKQAFILAFSDTFYLLGATLIVALIAALLLKKPSHVEGGGAH